jgi:hypothetical protein
MGNNTLAVAAPDGIALDGFTVAGGVPAWLVLSSPVDDQAQLQRVDVDSRPVDSASRALAETLNPHADRLNSLLFTSQDYAAVARRP